MRNLPEYEKWINEGTGEIFNPKRNKPTEFDPYKHPEIKGELFDLISTAYAEIGGHAKIKSPNDVLSDPDWNFWEGIDIHGNEDFDIVMFGQKTKFGIKFSGVGHDGSREAKREYLDLRGDDLHKLGYYIEVSGKLADILIGKYRVPVVEDRDEVEKVLGKTVNWTGECSDNPNALGKGWYIRQLGGHPHAKILLGRPKI
jgi:hypothetical protein